MPHQNGNVFTKKKTNILKGISILLLLVHHCFYNEFIGEGSTQVYLLRGFSEAFTYLGASSIFIFAALSGFGLGCSFQDPSTGYKRVVVKREIGLLSNYIPVYWLGLLAMMIDSQSILGPIFQTYGDRPLPAVFELICDSIAIPELLKFPRLNPTWWYMGAAHIIILAVPIFILLSKKMPGTDIGFLALFAIYGARHQDYDNILFDCFMCAAIGAWMAMHDIPQRVSAFFTSRSGRVLELIALLLFMAAYYKLFIGNFFFFYFISAIMMPFTIILVNDFAAFIPGIGDVLAYLGGLSSLMYMSHTFLLSLLTSTRTLISGFRYACISYFVLLAMDVLLCAAIRFLFERTGYNRFIRFLSDKLHESIS